MKIVIYGRTDGSCGYCNQAKGLCESMGLDFEYIDAPTSEYFQNTYVSKGIRTVPQIYVDNVHVGGFQEFFMKVA